jgi:hypothetical protein
MLVEGAGVDAVILDSSQGDSTYQVRAAQPLPARWVCLWCITRCRGVMGRSKRVPHRPTQMEMIKYIKAAHPSLDVIAGNVVTGGQGWRIRTEVCMRTIHRICQPCRWGRPAAQLASQAAPALRARPGRIPACAATGPLQGYLRARMPSPSAARQLLCDMHAPCRCSQARRPSG